MIDLSPMEGIHLDAKQRMVSIESDIIWNQLYSQKELFMQSTTTQQTTDTLQHQLTAIAQGDLEAILSDYTEESLLFLPDNTRHGLDQVRAFFANLLATLPADWMINFKMIRQDVAEEVAYIFWQAPPIFPLATDTFVVRDGKILVQTFAMLAAS